MCGLFLLIFGILFIIFFFLIFIDDYNDDIWLGLTVGCGIILIGFIVSIPVNRIYSKTKVAYIESVQITLDNNRELFTDINSIERISILKEVNSCNAQIAGWKTKGQKWYNNKWYYHPSVNDVNYIK